LIATRFTHAAVAAKLAAVQDAQPRTSRLLVVEDEPLLQLLIVDTMRDIGLAAEAVGSAAEALERLRGQPDNFAGAVVDVGLPDRPGDELVAEMRALRATLPIILSTGQDEAAFRDRFGRDPLVGYLGKPYSIGQLEAALRAVGVSVLET
jgi:CheY-like chemotaxis protein